MKKSACIDISPTLVAAQLATRQCRVETTTDGKTIVVIYGETTNAEVIVYNPVYSPIYLLEEELK